MFCGMVVAAGHLAAAERDGLAAETLAGQVDKPLWQLTAGQAKEIIRRALPAIAAEDAEETGALGWQYTVRGLVYRATGFDLTQPSTLLATMLPRAHTVTTLVEHLPGSQSANEVATAAAEVQQSTGASASAIISGQAPKVLSGLVGRDWGERPLVLIFHTHPSEMYTPKGDSGNAHKYNTTDTGIIHVGEVLADTLSSRYGIPVIHSKAIHDFPSFPQAYSASARTVKEVLKKYPSIQLVLDVHRDGVENLSFVRTVNGQRATQVAILATKPVSYSNTLHPNWWQNVFFAEEMAKKMEQLHPGLLRRSPLIVGTARYNQNLHPNMALLEVGTYLDDEAAALVSAGMIADTIAAMLAEVTKPDYKASIPKPQTQSASSSINSSSSSSTKAAQSTAKKQVQPEATKPQPVTASGTQVTPPKLALPTPLKAKP